jgi:hypothetical protein
MFSLSTEYRLPCTKTLLRSIPGVKPKGLQAQPVYICCLFPHTASMKNRLTAPPSAPLSRSSARTAALGWLLGCLGGAAFLAGCLQDPGQTGMGYLNEQGVKLSAPLYHFSFENLPVDSVFTTEATLDHYGDSQVVVGRQNRFTSTVRLGFAITTPLQHRHIDTGLSLRFMPLRVRDLIGKNFLHNSTRGSDSLALLVESFTVVDTTGDFQDSLNKYDARILRARVSFATLSPLARRLDTIRVSPKWAYDTAGQDTTQVRSLPHLKARIDSVGDSTSKWSIFLEISPLPGTTDSGMFRFSTQTRGNSALVRSVGSGLWLGHYHKDSIATKGVLLQAYPLSGTGKPGSTYQVKYTGPSTQSLLFGVQRGAHLRLNRDTLLARIQAGLYAAGDSALANTLGASPGGKFDRRFYVPYAELRLPLRDSLNRVDGPFAYDMAVTSEVDSVPDGETLRNIPVLVGDSVRLAVIGGPDYSPLSRDSLRLSYRVHPQDSTQRQILMAWAKAPTVVDTLTVTPDGVHREFTTRRHADWLRQTSLGATPEASRLLVGVYFSAQSFSEPNFIVDSTGRNASTNAGLKRRFYRPGADSLTVRVTRGVGQVLNRVSASGVAPDIYLRHVERSVFDTAASSTGSTYNRISFPVMGEVGLPRASDGKLRVGLDVYLYPLEGGQ